MEGKRKREVSDADSASKVSSSQPYPDLRRSERLLNAVTSQSGIRGRLIIYNSGNPDGSPWVTLVNSLSAINLQCTYERDPVTNEHKFLIGDEVIVTAPAEEYENKQTAKYELSKRAYLLLEEDCFVLYRKTHAVDVKEKDLESVKSLPSSTTDTDFNKPGSIAHKMMMKMGWAGGGLGASEQGKRENVQVYENIERRGLGNKNILKEVDKILKNFKASNKLTILVFDPAFTKEERELIHKTARRLDLKSKSEGKGEDRKLMVSKKTTRFDIVKELLEEGGENKSYKLQIPQNFIHLYY